MTRYLTLLSAYWIAGCSGATLPPGAPPTPASVTRDEPGGDSFDPHAAALQRLVDEPWGQGADRDGQLGVPLADPAHWKRTRYFLLDHFTGFRYGTEPHALNVVFVRDVAAGSAPAAADCLKEFEAWLEPLLDTFGIALSDVETLPTRWHQQPAFVRVAEAELDYGIGREHYAVAWTAFPAYSDACLVFGTSVTYRQRGDLARRARDRWAEQAPPAIEPWTPTRPYRREL